MGFWKAPGEKVNPSWTLAGHGAKCGVWEGNPWKMAYRVQNGSSLGAGQSMMWNVNQELLFLLVFHIVLAVCQRKPQKALEQVNGCAPS